MPQLIDVPAFVQFEASGWNRVADAYHRFFGPVTGRAVEPLLDAAAVGPSTRVLDVATGPGYVAERAAARGAQVTAVDIAPEILALARRRCPEVTFRSADAHDLPFGAAAFDAVVANFLVPHLGDHHQALGEFVRVLAAGGRLALTTWDRPERVPLLGAVVTAVRLAGAQPPPDIPAGPDFFGFSDDDAFAGLLQGAGLDDVAVQRLEFTHQLPSAAALWDGVICGTVRTAALVRSQPAAVQRRIRRAFEQLVVRYRDGAAVRLPVSVKIARGCKAARAAASSPVV